MTSFLHLSVTFIDATFHGRRDGGVPEWPPSPLRLFQAIVAAAAMRWRKPEFADHAVPGLRWLEEQPPPTIIAPASVDSSPYRLSVPNNAMDIVAKAWVRGNTSGEGDANPATHRAMKTVRPIRLQNGATVHYLWELPTSPPDEVIGFIEFLSAAIRSVVALGWGIDLVAGNGRVSSESEADSIPGDRWIPINDSAHDGLRVAIKGTLAAVVQRHDAFLNRLPSPSAFNPVPPLSAFRTVGYRRATDPAARPFAAFQLLKPDASGFRPFDVGRHARTVAGMVRHAAAQAARDTGWSEDRIASFVLGHGESASDRKHVPVGLRRFAYLPIPSLEGRGAGRTRVVGSIRRVVITTLAEGCDREIDWARRALSGMELIDERNSQPTALLSLLSTSDGMIGDYTRSAVTWSTVTPVVLPGFDDRDSRKAELLLRKALRQAGFSDLLARYAVLDWRKVGYWSGTELPKRQMVPEYLRCFSTYHVRISWRDGNGVAIPVPGPIIVGGGRYTGLGLFAAERG